MINQQGKRKIILTLIVLITGIMVAMAEDERFHGGKNDGYTQSSALDVPITLPSGTIITIF